MIDYALEEFIMDDGYNMSHMSDSLINWMLTEYPELRTAFVEYEADDNTEAMGDLFLRALEEA